MSKAQKINTLNDLGVSETMGLSEDFWVMLSPGCFEEASNIYIYIPDDYSGRDNGRRFP